jgi:hypothetical protein
MDEPGPIFLAWSTDGRGGEELLGIDRCRDATPKGRLENGPYRTLADRLRPRAAYGLGRVVEVPGDRQSAGACVAHR